MATDRGIYRRDDKVEVWGYLRGRDDGAVPSSVDVRLVINGGGRTPGAPIIATVNVRPGTDGSFTATLPVGGLPLGGYEVQAARRRSDDRRALRRGDRHPEAAVCADARRRIATPCSSGETVNLTAQGQLLRRVAGPVARRHVPGRGRGRRPTRDHRSVRERLPRPSSSSPVTRSEDTASRSISVTPSDPKVPRSRRIGRSSSSRPRTTWTRAATSATVDSRVDGSLHAGRPRQGRAGDRGRHLGRRRGGRPGRCQARLGVDRRARSGPAPGRATTTTSSTRSSSRAMSTTSSARRSGRGPS